MARRSRLIFEHMSDAEITTLRKSSNADVRSAANAEMEFRLSRDERESRFDRGYGWRVWRSAASDAIVIGAIARGELTDDDSLIADSADDLMEIALFAEVTGMNLPSFEHDIVMVEFYRRSAAYVLEDKAVTGWDAGARTLAQMVKENEKEEAARLRYVGRMNQ